MTITHRCCPAPVQLGALVCIPLEFEIPYRQKLHAQSTFLVQSPKGSRAECESRIHRYKDRGPKSQSWMLEFFTQIWVNLGTYLTDCCETARCTVGSDRFFFFLARALLLGSLWKAKCTNSVQLYPSENVVMDFIFFLFYLYREQLPKLEEKKKKTKKPIFLCWPLQWGCINHPSCKFQIHYTKCYRLIYNVPLISIAEKSLKHS